jgi:hypothetical protein
MARGGLALVPLAALTLWSGMLLYHAVEGLAWSDAFLNASMILGGVRPVDRLYMEMGKWLARGYALFCGLFFIVLAGVMLAPVLHDVLHRLRLDAEGTRPVSTHDAWWSAGGSVVRLIGSEGPLSSEIDQLHSRREQDDSGRQLQWPASARQ